MDDLIPKEIMSFLEDDDSQDQHSEESVEGRNLDYGHQKSDSHEGKTAKRALLTMAKDLYHLYITLNDSDDLPEWCHYKLATSRKDLGDVTDYITSKILKHCMDNELDQNDIQEAIKKSINNRLNENLFNKVKDFFVPKKNIPKSSIKSKKQTLPKIETAYSAEADTQPFSKETIDLVQDDALKGNNTYQILDDLKKLDIVLSKLDLDEIEKISREKDHISSRTTFYKQTLLKPFEAILKKEGYISAIDKILLLTSKKPFVTESNENYSFNEMSSDASILYTQQRVINFFKLKDSDIIKEIQDILDVSSLSLNEIKSMLKEKRSKLLYFCRTIQNALPHEFLNSEKNKSLKERQSFLTYNKDYSSAEISKKSKNASGQSFTLNSNKVSINDLLNNNNPYLKIVYSAKELSEFYNKHFNNNIISKEIITSFYEKLDEKQYFSEFFNVIESIDYMIESLLDVQADSQKVFKQAGLVLESNTTSLDMYHKKLLGKIEDVNNSAKTVDDMLDIIISLPFKSKVILIKDFNKSYGQSLKTAIDHIVRGLINFKLIYKTALEAERKER